MPDRLGPRGATIAWVVYVLGLGLLMAPALARSIGGDDVHWTMETAAYTSGDYLRVLLWSFTDMPAQQPQDGRFAQINYLLQRAADLATMDVAVALAIPPAIPRAFLVVGLFVGMCGAVMAFLRAVRVPLPSGALGRLGARELRILGTLMPLLLALGMRAQTVGTLNGWVYYPVLTYGAVIIVFGLAATAAASVDLVARHRGLGAGIAVVGLAILAVLLVISYELFYVAVPLAICLVIARGPVRSAWAPRVIVLLAFAGVFLVAVVATRIYLAAACADGGCYSGVELNLGGSVVRTAWWNVVSSFPVPTPDLVMADRAVAGARGIGRFAALMLGVTLVAAAALLVVRAARPRAQDQATPPRVLVVVAALAIATTLAASVVMALSTRSQELVTTWGLPYRSGVIAWAGIAIAVASLSLLAARTRRSALPLGVAAAALTLLAVVSGLPANVAATVADRLHPTRQQIDAIQYEVALGDRSPEADARRCDLLQDFLDDNDIDIIGYERVVSGAYAAFEHYHGIPFCSDLLGPWDVVPTEI